MNMQNIQETAPRVPENLILWDKETVKQAIGWKSDAALYRAIKSLDFPEPVKIGFKKSMWRKHRVLAWMENLEEGIGQSNAYKN